MRRVAAAAALLAVLAGCGNRVPPNTFQVWTISLRPLFTSYMQDVIARWEALHPGVHVDWIDLPIDAIQQKLIVALASGHPPSVVNLNTDMANQLADMGVLENLNAAIPAPRRAVYFPGFWNAHAIPWYVSATVIMYNADLFRRAGLDPDKPPASWGDLIADAKAIEEKTGVAGWLPSIKFIDELQEQGIPVVSADGKHALFDSPRAVEWLDMYVKLFQAGVLPRESILLSKAYAQAVDLYQAGRLGVLMTGPQFLNRVRDNAPSIYAATRVAPVPMGPGKVIGAGVMNFVIPENAPMKNDAIDFALFLTDDENQLRFCQMVPVFPSTIKAAGDPFFSSPSGDPLMARARKIGAGELKEARDLTLDLKNEKDRNEAIQDAVVSALLGEKTPDRALRDASAIWDRLLQ